MLAFAASGAAEQASTTPAADEAQQAEPQATEDSDTQRWWSFDQAAVLEGLGLGAEGGIFRLGMWRNVLDLRATGNLQSTKSEGFADREFYSYLTTEGLTLRNSGWSVIDPRLLTGSASIRFALQQARQDAGEQGTAQDGDMTDYHIDMTFLQQKPGNLNLQASHVEAVTSLAGGGTTASSNSLRGATLNWREASILREKEIAPYFSATLFGGQEDLQETTTNAGVQFRREEQRKRVEFDAHNGFENGDLTVNLEQLDLTNLIVPAASYRSQTADLTYSLDFGKNLTRHSDLHVNYNDRDGEFGATTFDVDELLYFEHNAFLSSSVFYILQDVDSPDGSSTMQRIDGGVQYMPFLNVSTNLNALGSRVEYDTGTIDGFGGSAGLSYNHWLPAGGVLTATASGGLQFSNSQLTSATVPVVDATYQAPPELGAGAGFLLNESDVVTSTIVVFDVRGGSRLPTELGVDYEVETEGNLTKIIPLATSPVIQAGDPLEISYSYLTDPLLKSRVRNQSYSIGADYGWIGVSLTHDINEQDPLSGQQQTALGDQKRTTLRVDVSHDRGALRARANARAARYRDERLDYDEIRLNENLSWQPYYDWQLGFDASQTQAKFIDTGRVSRHYDARLGGSWHSRRGWWADGYLSWRTQQDSEMVDETITEAFIRVRRNWPQLAFSASLGLGQRDRGPVQTFYQNLQIYITRTF